MNQANSNAGPAARRRWPSMGAISLVLLALNTAGVFWAVWVVGTGVDSGIPLFYFLMSVTFPLFIFTTVLAVIAVVKRKGRAPGAITAVISMGVFAWLVYSFLESQVF